MEVHAYTTPGLICLPSFSVICSQLGMEFKQLPAPDKFDEPSKQIPKIKKNPFLIGSCHFNDDKVVPVQGCT